MTEEVYDERPPWLDAAEEVMYQWHLFSKATTPVLAANYLVELSNAMSDLQTYHPGWDYKTGTMPWERDDDD